MDAAARIRQHRDVANLVLLRVGRRDAVVNETKLQIVALSNFFQIISMNFRRQVYCIEDFESVVGRVWIVHEVTDYSVIAQDLAAQTHGPEVTRDAAVK